MKESKRNDYHIFHEDMFAKISGENGIDLSQKEVVVNYGSHSADFIKQFEPKIAEIRIKMGEILYSKFKNNIMKTGIELITEERQKQIDKHGFTAKHHAMHPEWYDKGQLIEAAHKLSYIMSNDETPENWDAEWFSNLCRRPHQERLIIAAALVASELDRLMYLINNNTDIHYCEKCGGKLALVSGTFYFTSDAEPYESGVEEELYIDTDLHIHANYCVECHELPQIWEG